MSGVANDERSRAARHGMSAFAAIYRRDGDRAEQTDLVRMLDAMAHRGRDGRGEYCRGPVAMGHLHFWTTPEEIGEAQPLASQGCARLAWDGRIDNRAELADLVGGYDAQTLKDTSDAQLFLGTYLATGTAFFDRVLGSFAFVLYDERTRELLLGRDPMGNRSVYYSTCGTTILVASEEAGLLAHPRAPRGADESSLAAFFAATDCVHEGSVFAGLRLLAPGWLLRAGGGGIRMEQFAQLDLNGIPECTTREDYQERFRQLLFDAVAARSRRVDRLGTTVSGGLDSCPITAAAANSVPGDALTAFTWAFDEHPVCDERNYARSLCQRYGVPLVEVNCDRAWPLSEPQTWPVHPTMPAQDAYRRFHELTYVAARDAGTRVLLTGMLGDVLYLGLDRYWFASIVARGWRHAIDQARSYARHRGFRALLREGLSPRWLADQWRRQRITAHYPWLTGLSRALLLPDPESAGDGDRAEQWQKVMDRRNAREQYIESYYAHRYGIECRYPFRDRRLVEFLLQVPATQLYSVERTRPIVRDSMKDFVPQPILQRRGKTSFEPLFRIGLDKENQTAAALLGSPSRLWNRYVDGHWLERAGDDPRSMMVKWLCLSFELWRDRSPFGMIYCEQLSGHA